MKWGFWGRWILFTIGIGWILNPARAASEEKSVASSTLFKHDMRSRLTLSAATVILDESGYNDGLLAPVLSGEWDLGPVSLSLSMPMFFYIPVSPSLKVKTGKCIDGIWSLCVGGGLGLAVNVHHFGEPNPDIDYSPSPTSRGGSIAQQDPLLYTFAPVAIEPEFFYSVTNGALFGRLRGGLFIPFEKDKIHGQLAFPFEAAIGYRVGSWFFPEVSFSGIVSSDEFFWINATARAEFEHFAIWLRWSFPLNERSMWINNSSSLSSEDAGSIQFELGLSYLF